MPRCTTCLAPGVAGLLAFAAPNSSGAAGLEVLEDADKHGPVLRFVAVDRFEITATPRRGFAAAYYNLADDPKRARDLAAEPHTPGHGMFWVKINPVGDDRSYNTNPVDNDAMTLLESNAVRARVRFSGVHTNKGYVWFPFEQIFTVYADGSVFVRYALGDTAEPVPYGRFLIITMAKRLLGPGGGLETTSVAEGDVAMPYPDHRLGFHLQWSDGPTYFADFLMAVHQGTYPPHYWHEGTEDDLRTSFNLTSMFPEQEVPASGAAFAVMMRFGNEMNGTAAAALYANAYRDPDSMTWIDGSAVTTSEGDLGGDGFDEQEGCYSIRAGEDGATFVLHGASTPRPRPIFKISGWADDLPGTIQWGDEQLTIDADYVAAVTGDTLLLQIDRVLDRDAEISITGQTTPPDDDDNTTEASATDADESGAPDNGGEVPSTSTSGASEATSSPPSTTTEGPSGNSAGAVAGSCSTVPRRPAPLLLLPLLAWRRRLCGLAFFGALAGCYQGTDDGVAQDSGPDAASEGGTAPSDDDDTQSEAPVDPAAVAVQGMRRLTRSELDATMRSLLLDATFDTGATLPEDSRTPFDNDIAAQVASEALIVGLNLIAVEATQSLLDDPPRRDAVVGCVPSGPGDLECLRGFIRDFGRRAFRRPVTDEEVDELASAIEFAKESGDFYTAVEDVLQAILQDPQFVYRVERGIPVPDHAGVFKLNEWEIATRMAFFITGSTPPDWLLDEAEAEKLGHAEERRAAAQQLWNEAGRTRFEHFHALWLGYDRVGLDADLGPRMRAETTAAIERVLFEDERDWVDLFTLRETLVDDALAEHYGLDLPGSATPTWVGYGDSGRGGVLSHATFLAAAIGKDGDTSPTSRGLHIRRRLLCGDVPPPPPDVNPDDPVPQTEDAVCKKDRYALHATSGSCATCHDAIDPIGWGLENYDMDGRYRDVEPEQPQCEIDGAGKIAGVGTFNGPAELGSLLAASDPFRECMLTQLYRFAVGRAELDDADQRFITQWPKTEEGMRLSDLVLNFVGADAFGFRREEA